MTARTEQAQQREAERCNRIARSDADELPLVHDVGPCPRCGGSIDRDRGHVCPRYRIGTAEEQAAAKEELAADLLTYPMRGEP